MLLPRRVVVAARELLRNRAFWLLLGLCSRFVDLIRRGPGKEAIHAAIQILDESWILTQNPAHYTIQVIGLSSKERTEILIENFDHLAPLAIFTVQRSFKPIHILIQGSYPELDMARQQRDAFPSEINPPDQLLILKFGKIQALIESEGGNSG